MRTHTTLDSPVGPLTLVNADGVLCGLYLQGQAHHPDPAGFGTATEAGFGPVRAELAEYFAGARTTFTVSLAPVGSAFELRVWGLLRTIPYGETRSYGQLAERLGAARAIIARRGEEQEATRVLLERMLLEPGRYRFTRISRADVGEPGCGAWHVRPRLGLIGMLAGWWHVKISSGCPLPGATDARPWPLRSLTGDATTCADGCAAGRRRRCSCSS